MLIFCVLLFILAQGRNQWEQFTSISTQTFSSVERWSLGK